MQAISPSVPPQRVPVVISSPAFPTLPKKLLPPQRRPSLPSNYRAISPRFHIRPLPRLQLAQSIQHQPYVAGKCFILLQAVQRQLIWTTSLTNEWARCAQGLSANRPPERHIVGNQTIFFIRPGQVPAGRKVTYANFVCTMRPCKAEPYHIRMTVGGDPLDAYQDVCSPAVGITNTKLHMNSSISDAKHGARYCTGDLKDFFLVSTMTIFQYMRVHQPLRS